MLEMLQELLSGDISILLEKASLKVLIFGLAINMVTSLLKNVIPKSWKEKKDILPILYRGIVIILSGLLCGGLYLVKKEISLEDFLNISMVSYGIYEVGYQPILKRVINMLKKK